MPVGATRTSIRGACVVFNSTGACAHASYSYSITCFSHLSQFESLRGEALPEMRPVQTLAFFPRDRSRLDGRWHTCRACNRLHWREIGKQRSAWRKQKKRVKRESRQGLQGLKKYPQKRRRSSFESLPESLRWIAQQLFNRYAAKHRGRLTQPRLALLMACAASNARRVGDSAWARRMRRLKGYRRAEGRKAAQEEQLAEIRAKNAGK